MAHQGFPIDDLSPELALEIFRHAALPQDTTTTGKSVAQVAAERYNIARQIATTSRLANASANDLMYHTVIFASPENTKLFLDHWRGKTITPHIVRLWCSFFDDIHYPDAQRMNQALFNLIRNVQSLGVPAYSPGFSDMLDVCDTAGSWNCKRVTLEEPRWNPFTSSHQGNAFLQKITHLCVWMPYHDPNTLPGATPPSWLRQVPFKFMPNLQYFAFPLLEADHQGRPMYDKMCVYAVRGSVPRDVHVLVNQCSTVKMAHHPTVTDARRWDIGYVLDEVERVWARIGA